MSTPDRDRERLRAVRAGDRSAWRAWYDDTFPALDRYLLWRCGGLRDVADDLLQEVWLVAVRRLDQFDPAQGAFLAWLRGIATGLLANRWRSLARQRRLQPVPTSQQVTAEPADASSESRDERAESVARALAELPPLYEEVLRRRYLEGQAVAQMASEMNCSLKAVESRLSRAREAFRAIYEEEQTP
jgi:RNA polymerase sigma-70 factor (ECF subfamily)